jgi:hypothetical protein
MPEREPRPDRGVKAVLVDTHYFFWTAFVALPGVLWEAIRR